LRRKFCLFSCFSEPLNCSALENVRDSTVPLPVSVPGYCSHVNIFGNEFSVKIKQNKLKTLLFTTSGITRKLCLLFLQFSRKLTVQPYVETCINYQKWILKGLGQEIDFKTFDKNLRFRGSSDFIFKKLKFLPVNTSSTPIAYVQLPIALQSFLITFGV
jgi:hypothetical protein